MKADEFGRELFAGAAVRVCEDEQHAPPAKVFERDAAAFEVGQFEGVERLADLQPARPDLHAGRAAARTTFEVVDAEQHPPLLLDELVENGIGTPKWKS